MIVEDADKFGLAQLYQLGDGSVALIGSRLPILPIGRKSPFRGGGKRLQAISLLSWGPEPKIAMTWRSVAQGIFWGRSSTAL